ncbi:hypothetical protein DFJ74DRAFT_770070 [Hyaloraphidium curvatum]|nr:hypothetical protein DFJ74DRAFT_770070 [Hyaloraphidium curvatum]
MGLAEPRRRQRISADPQNQTWARDKSKFGYVLMQKMGWSAERGLGKNGEGMKEHIKLWKKEDSLGVGATKKTVDAWLDNTDAFDALLKSLNQDAAGSSEKGAESDADTETGSGTGSNPSVGGHRLLHRKKFVRNKQVSNYDSKDITMILGKRKAGDERSDAGAASPAAASDDSRPATPVEEFEPKTVVQKMTSAEYFADKMKRLGRVGSVSTSDAASYQATAGLGFGGLREGSDDGFEGVDRKEAKKRRKAENVAGPLSSVSDGVANGGDSEKARRKAEKRARKEEKRQKREARKLETSLRDEAEAALGSGASADELLDKASRKALKKAKKEKKKRDRADEEA